MIEDKILGPKNPGETSASEHIKTPTRHGALKLFEKAKTRLMDVNNWDQLCGTESAVFRLTNMKGNLLDSSKPEIGNLIRIELPGSPDEAATYNWLKVEEFESSRDLLKDEDVFEFRLKQVFDPFGKRNSPLHADKTIAFQLRRVASKVDLVEVGGNGIFDSNTDNFKWKNIFSLFSALLGLSDPQWKKLIKGILQEDPNEEQQSLFN